MSIFEFNQELHNRTLYEEGLGTIETICRAAEPFAPEYDAEKIYEAMKQNI